jgi:hypothetical protein
VSPEGLGATAQTKEVDGVVEEAITARSTQTVSTESSKPSKGIRYSARVSSHDSDSVSEAPSEAHSDDNPFLDTVMIPQPPQSSPEDNPTLEPVELKVEQTIVKESHNNIEAAGLPSAWSLKSRSKTNTETDSDRSDSPTSPANQPLHKEPFRDLPRATPPTRSSNTE